MWLISAGLALGKYFTYLASQTNLIFFHLLCRCTAEMKEFISTFFGDHICLCLG